MIIDRIENAKTYPFGETWEAAIDFLQSITPETEVKQHVLREKELHVDMAEYNTKSREEALIENHIKYIDIQFMIDGEEAQEVFLTDNLSASTDYNTVKDATFYHEKGTPHTRVVLHPGYFAAYFPQDAHRGCMMSGDAPQPVKKAVAKVAISTLRQ